MLHVFNTIAKSYREIGNGTVLYHVQTLLIPRLALDEVAKRDEIQNVGIYFLIGTTGDGAKPILYVGEAENCLTRLKQHNKSKGFWNTAIVAISKTQCFTKPHVKYLEWYCHESAKKADRYPLKIIKFRQNPISLSL